MPKQLTTYQKARLQVVVHRNIQALATEVLSPHGINTSQWVILGWLKDNPAGMRVTALAEVLQVETPLITSLTQPLVAKNLIKIEADSQDKRARQLTLMESGEQLVNTVEVQLATRLKLAEKGIRKNSLASYYAILEKLIANFMKSSN